MGLFAFFFNKTNRNLTPRQPQVPAIMPIPRPAPALNANREEELFQYIHTQLQRGIESSFNGSETIYISLFNSNDNYGTSSSFGASKKDLSWTDPLSLAERIRILTYIRHEVGVAGWKVIKCGIHNNRVHLQIQPAREVEITIPGPSDIWPHITTTAELMVAAVQDLTTEVTNKIISDGGATLVFTTEILPASCVALPSKDLLRQAIDTVRNRIAEKWMVAKFEFKEIALKIECDFRWKESTGVHENEGSLL